MYEQYLQELLDEPVVINPSNRTKESEHNTWSISRDETVQPVDIFKVERSLAHLATDWLAKAKVASPLVSATFYSWYDDQTGKLRLSLTSCGPDNLPFGCNVVLQDRPITILNDFLFDRQPGVIAINTLTPHIHSRGALEAHLHEEPDPIDLNVWTQSTHK